MNYNYEKALNEAMSRIEKAINAVCNQELRPIVPTYKVEPREMLRLALEGKLLLGHYCI